MRNKSAGGRRPGFRRPRLLELELVGFGLDDEKDGALLDLVAVPVANLLDEALHAGNDIGAVDRRRGAGCFEVARDVLLDRQRHLHLRRRRRHVAGCPLRRPRPALRRRQRAADARSWVARLLWRHPQNGGSLRYVGMSSYDSLRRAHCHVARRLWSSQVERAGRPEA
jgi:hypothetical protein